MDTIALGTSGERKLLVTPEETTNFLGNENARVLSTPHMIAYMEWTSRDAIKPLLPEGWDSVGTIVNIRHLAATPIGMNVTFTARVTGVDGNRVTFAVEAYDEKEKIGEGVHERFIVDVNRFATRLAMKKES
ncbi:MAG TPA: thioesterase family protein [Bryobacteraceae bacterium]|nr:thioesterase family protein [Bryobacteraceae bacterium]HPT27818.1 thioesterase family protein [Bryobacteraceae bacterium]